MKTIVDMDAAFLKVRIETEKWEQEFNQAFYMPLIQAQATQQFLSLPAADRDRLKQIDPALHAELTANVKHLILRMKMPPAGDQEQSTQTEADQAAEEGAEPPGQDLQEQEG